MSSIEDDQLALIIEQVGDYFSQTVKDKIHKKLVRDIYRSSDKLTYKTSIFGKKIIP